VLVLLANTRYTLLDEPFSHIMPLHVDRLKQLIERQKAKKGILLTDHMYRHLLDVSDTLYLMKEGKSIYIKDRENLVLHGYLRQLDEV
jgi:ABC-type lipopolysaccharide export system ATPase subunit